MKLTGANDLPLEILGKTMLRLNVRKTADRPGVFIVRNLPYEGILGQDLMSSLGDCAVFNWHKRTVSFLNSAEAPWVDAADETERFREAGVFAVDLGNGCKSGWVCARESFTIPPMSESILNGEWHGNFQNEDIMTLDTLQRPVGGEEEGEATLEVAHSIHSINRTDPDNLIVVGVLNGTEQPIFVQRGDVVAQANKVELNRSLRRASAKMIASLTIEDFAKHKPRPAAPTSASDDGNW